MGTQPTGKGGRKPQRFGKYEVLRHVASGGMGAVYKALDTETKREVALKVLPPDLAANPKMCERFQREAQSVAKLRHENIVALYEFGETNGTFYLALEFIDGIDLHEYIERHGKLDIKLARELLKQATKALAHAHSQNLVHRDIKPSNFLVTEKDGQPLLKLTDLGLARDPRETDGRITRDGTTIGTVDYMSPEQAHDSGRADIRSDIYSLGCTFYHMLAGHAPFNEGSLIEKVTRHANIEPPGIRSLNPDVPDDLVYILGRTLRKDPDQRYQTPLELLHDLLNPEKIPAEPRWRRWTNRGRKIARGIWRMILASSPPPSPPRPPKGREFAPRPRSAAGLPSLPIPLPNSRIIRMPRPLEGWVKSNITATRRWRVGPSPVAFFCWSRSRLSSRLPARSQWRWRTRRRRHRFPISSLRQKRLSKYSRLPKSRSPRRLPSCRGFMQLTCISIPRSLQLDFEGPLAVLKGPDSHEKVLTVCRFGGGQAGVYGTLAEALAASADRGPTTIVIADDGPLFVSSLPPVVGRDLTIRAAKGFKPLIVWETTGDKGSALVKVSKGNVVLENLELVVKWTDPRGDEPAAFVQVTGGSFVASHCTFSANGNHPRGFAAVRLEAPDRPGVCRLTDCYVRGPDMTALSLAGVGWDAQIDDCLLVTGPSPLVDVACAARAPVTLRVLRSTLVAGKDCFVVHQPAGNDNQPEINLRLLDSLFAHCDNGTAGNLLAMNGTLDPSSASIRVTNCVYAGWNKLLASANKSILGTDLAGWRGMWRHDVGDRASVDVWPAVISPEPEESPAALYATNGGPAYFAAVSSKGLLGSPLDYHERPMWLGLTYERFGYPALALPTGIADTTRDGILLTKDMDLAQIIASQAKPGQKLILKVYGSGEIETRPIVVKGFDLTLCCDTVADAKDRPLTLVPDPTRAIRKPCSTWKTANWNWATSAWCFPTATRSCPGGCFASKGRTFGCMAAGCKDRSTRRRRRFAR